MAISTEDVQTVSDTYAGTETKVVAPNWNDTEEVRGFLSNLRSQKTRGTISAVERVEKYLLHKRLAENFRTKVEAHITRLNGIPSTRTHSGAKTLTVQLRKLYMTYTPSMLKAQAKVYDLNPAMYEPDELLEAIISEAVTRAQESVE